jgi:hypothetical protein
VCARVADERGTAAPFDDERAMDAAAEIPPQVRQLLEESVDSVEKLEVLFLAWREPETAWTVATTSARLRLPADAVATALAELEASRLLATSGAGYRYAPSNETDRAAVSALCTLYDDDRLLLLREVTSLAMTRIRSSAARAFSDAFRFRKRDPGGGDNDA